MFFLLTWSCQPEHQKYSLLILWWQKLWRLPMRENWNWIVLDLECPNAVAPFSKEMWKSTFSSVTCFVVTLPLSSTGIFICIPITVNEQFWTVSQQTATSHNQTLIKLDATEWTCDTGRFCGLLCCDRWQATTCSYRPWVSCHLCGWDLSHHLTSGRTRSPSDKRPPLVTGQCRTGRPILESLSLTVVSLCQASSRNNRPQP